ncbi:NAD(P)(+) transhydrogenase (Re/Si-specific) subunit beta [Aidingimonas halophila]|uniref:NAD(P) transhydrogenase subunit beta n=1 Tax=Aidingimonas halophila TaxID=574349 RepID=A0A1H3F325_9GAMM|nr:NAD(P)(+) transhydrogenase (Re/Si-specific) subunit beta [Aidingimonas halophila]GHC32277.1 NAD(P) transhydrogenase subunit beta [Aidingimonas halophila]SDX85423.1 NAD(P) transhydrogenase subunit beta [Aidingimonas halophila]
MSALIETSYFATAVLFILGLKRMSHPTTARSGVIWAGVGMALATLVTFLHPEIRGQYGLMLLAILIGGGVAWWSAKRVAMTDMPQMIAIYNGMGGGAAGGIAAVELMRVAGDPSLVESHGHLALWLGVLGALIGSVAFSGSVIAWAKLDGRMKKAVRFANQQQVTLAILAAAVLLGIWVALATPGAFVLFLFFLLALAFGVMVALPIGGADMPVVISLFNALTGLAVAMEGFVLDNAAMIIAGTVVGAAGSLLTVLMAKAMNRSLFNILFKQFGPASDETTEIEGSIKDVGTMDAAVQMAYADRVIIVPGYGLAVAQAQHKLWEMVELLQERGVEVSFAIHPVAGRMPGHMNVLLAEAGVPYDMIFDLEEINNDFETTDVALVIGANDVVNPVAKTDPDSPLYGMPVLNVDEARNVLVVKRGQGAGFSGVENHLFYRDNTRMVYGDGQKVVTDMIASIKTL